jgi:uncharacterized protein YjaG (DUF416 family)
LAELPTTLQVAYALLIAERLYPALVAYSRETHGQEAREVRKYLDELWDGLEGGGLDGARLREIADVVFELRPETEDNPSPIASYALDAAAAAWEAIQSAITSDPAHAVAAAQIAFDSIYLNQEEREGLCPQSPADQRTILMREPVVKELEMQDGQLRRAEAFSRTPQKGVSVLRHEYGRPQQSLHGLS